MKTEPNIYLIVPALYPNAGGLTKAMFDKANYLSNFFNVEILTTNFQLHFNKIRNDLEKSGKLSPSVNVRNIYNDISQRNTKNKIGAKFDFEELLEKYDALSVDKGEGRDRVFGWHGTYQNYISYHKGKIHFIDYMDEFDPTVLRKRYIFDQGNLLAMETMADGKKQQQVIFNRHKNPVLNIWHKDNQPNRIFDMQGEGVFDTAPANLYKKWFESVITAEDVVLVDCFFSQVAGYLENIPCATIGFIHSHHDYDGDARFATHFSDFNKFVFLTKLQQEDFKSHNPAVTAKSSVLPHPVLKTVSPGQKEKKIVTISRLVSNKPVDLSIRAFAKIADSFPDFTYDIYGIGPNKDSLTELIKNLGLQGRVFLKGYVDNPLGKFEKAQLSIMLTKFEGYGLSILESLGMSCPVVTSAVNYGPSELVLDGVNGRLVSNTSIDEIASAITDILKHSSKYQENCLPSISDKSLDAWQLKLLKIISEAINNKETVS